MVNADKLGVVLTTPRYYWICVEGISGSNPPSHIKKYQKLMDIGGKIFKV